MGGGSPTVYRAVHGTHGHGGFSYGVHWCTERYHGIHRYSVHCTVLFKCTYCCIFVRSYKVTHIFYRNSFRLPCVKVCVLSCLEYVEPRLFRIYPIIAARIDLLYPLYQTDTISCDVGLLSVPMVSRVSQWCPKCHNNRWPVMLKVK